MDATTENNIRTKVAAHNALASVVNQNLEKFRTIISGIFSEGCLLTTQAQDHSALTKKVIAQAGLIVKAMEKEVDGFDLRFSFWLEYGHFYIKGKAHKAGTWGEIEEVSISFNDCKSEWTASHKNFYRYKELKPHCVIPSYDAFSIITAAIEVENLQKQLTAAQGRVGKFQRF